MAFLVAIFLVWIPCGLFASTVSSGKGHDGLTWFFGGLFFGPIALIAAAGLEDRNQRRYLRILAEASGLNLEKAADQTSEKTAEPVSDTFIKKETYVKAVEGYKRDGWGEREPSFNNSNIYEEKVVLRDIYDKVIITMVLYDGQWIKA